MPRPDDDPAAPLTIPAHEAFAHELLKGSSQAAAYRKVYPKSRKWSNQVVAVQASQLSRKISVRLEWLKERAARGAIATREEMLERHTAAARARFNAMPRFVQVLPDGEYSAKLTEENIKDPSVKRIKWAFKRGESGDGSDDVRILDMEFHDYLQADAENAKLQGFYAPSKNEHTGPDGKPLAPFVIVYDRAEQKAL